MLKNTRGNAAIITALSAPVIMAGLALGTETSFWFYKQRKLQAGADAGAYAAGIEKRAGASTTTIRTVAQQMALRSGYDGGGTMAVNSPPTSGPNTGRTDAVEVIINQNAPRFFTDFFDDSAVQMRARAVARFRTAANACVLALSGTASRAANFSGNTNLNLIGCSVMSNSFAADSVNVQGSARMSTPCIYAVGGAQLNSGASMTDAECRANGAKTGTSPVADPYADIDIPSTWSGPCRNGNGNNLQSGRYCNGLSLSGTVNLAAGVYYITGGDLRINANAFVRGTDITFILMGNARVSINGNARVDLQAPTTGTYAGLLFIGDRTATGGSRNTFNGTANSRMTGAIYFASQAVEYLGNFSGINGCTQIVGNTVEWSGSTTMQVDCSAYGMRSIPANLVVQLVE